MRADKQQIVNMDALYVAANAFTHAFETADDEDVVEALNALGRAMLAWVDEQDALMAPKEEG